MIAKALEILLIEDSVEDVEFLRESLKEGGILHHLHTVDNGVDAMLYLKKVGQYADSPSPDLVILDLNLPKKNGFEVLKEMREDNRMKDIPYVVLSVADLNTSTLQENQINPETYVRKSNDLSPLIHFIENAEKKVNRYVQGGADSRQKIEPSKEKQLKILLVEDNEEDANLLREILSLKEKFTWEITHVESIKKAFQFLDESHFDIIVLDLFLPDSQGFETLTSVIEHNKKTPIIVMTGLKDESVGVEALRHGAQDYLIKGQITADLFLRSVQYAIERQHLDQMKDDLIGYVNHELNNPLAVIKEGVSQVVEGLKGEINDQQRNLLNIALNGVSRLEHITRQLLDSMKLELQKVPLSKEDADLIMFVKETVEPFKLLADKQGLQIKERYLLDKAPVEIDKERLAQVLSNLLSNALKFTEEGFIEVSIEEKDPDYICRIKDSGKGIKPEDLGKTFMKFSRFGPREKHVKGTGLGLYISKYLIELHKGKIWVESTLNQGTTFSFSVPKKLA